MDKNILKDILKPVLKECLEEILAEKGLLNVLAEAQMAQTKLEPKKQEIKKQIQRLVGDAPQVAKKTVNEVQQRMQKELKQAGLLTKDFDPFAGTKPLTESQAAGATPAAGPLGGIDPNDKGVDISGIMNMAAGKWKAHLGGKSK